MDKQLILYVTLLFVLLIFLLPLHCSAIETSEIYLSDDDLTTYADQARKEDFYKTDDETQDAFIENFDVSNSGNILICLENDTVQIYDEDGTFQFAILYDSNGSGSMAFWNEENIVIYIYREHICVFFDADGTLGEIYEFNGDSTSLINSVLKKGAITLGDYTYSSEKSNFFVLLSSRDNQLTKQNNLTGEINTIYLYKAAGYRMVKFSIKIALFISIIVIGFLYGFNKEKVDRVIRRYFGDS